MSYKDEHEKFFFEGTMKGTISKPPENDEELMILWHAFNLAELTFKITENLNMVADKLALKKVLWRIKDSFKDYICYSYIGFRRKNAERQFKNWTVYVNSLYLSNPDGYSEEIKEKSKIFIDIINYYLKN